MFIEYRGKTPKVHPTAFVAPTAVLIGDVEVAEDASIWFGVVIRADNGPIRIGPRANVQDNSVLHVSEGCATIIGPGVTVGHGAILEDCTIEDGALVGTRAVVLNGAIVGRRSFVAAGSVVAPNFTVPAETLVAGSPAVVKKQLVGPAAAWVDHATDEYVSLSRSYLRHGIGDPEMHELAHVQSTSDAIPVSS
jgi:carbonic anhydrase/acetyltransferase-like protein (isoleucine patch superfamily)